jgi:hypothetical protein
MYNVPEHYVFDVLGCDPGALNGLPYDSGSEFSGGEVLQAAAILSYWRTDSAEHDNFVFLWHEHTS